MGYIKEDYSMDYYIFEEDEIVIVVGEVDGRDFDNVKAKILSKSREGEYETNMDLFGKCRHYDYRGTTYYIKPLNGSDDWYVPKFNLRHDFEIDEIDEKPGKIKWYKKGKFTNE